MTDQTPEKLRKREADRLATARAFQDLRKSVREQGERFHQEWNRQHPAYPDATDDERKT